MCICAALPKELSGWYSYSVKLLSIQKPSRYINKEINAVYKEAPVKVALAFPDIYEIGMSHLGLRVLYKIINDLHFASAERVFSPWTDLETLMRERGTPLASLETGIPLKDFDIVGFSMQYELSYTTILNMLDLGGIPVKSDQRHGPLSDRHRSPLVIAGGPCTVNPAPMSPFIDVFLVGDGEDAVKELLDIYYLWKREGDGKKHSLLLALSGIEGVYIPALRTGKKIARRFISSLDSAPFPDKPVVPYTAITHDRVNIEVARGCTRGCRFCQAGMIYRPLRERSPGKVLQLLEDALMHTGYEEVAFTSLSAGDYCCLLQVAAEVNRRFSKDRVALSLPSLRVGSVNRGLLKEIRTVRKTGFTIAPEAGTERLRKVINKDFSEHDYEEALRVLFEEGWLNLKLYFMIGLPTETEEDIEAIPAMAMKALKTAKQYTKRFVNINVGISPFVPKAHTPFQWCGQASPDELLLKKNRIRNGLMKKGFHIKGHDIEMSILEAAFARGDESLAPVIERAWILGCRLDGWTENFHFGQWQTAMHDSGIDIKDFSQRQYTVSDQLPWDNIDIGVTKAFLWEEFQKSISGDITPDCRHACHSCGLECSSQAGEVHAEKPDGELNLSAAAEGVRAPVLPGPGRGPQFKPVHIRAEFAKIGNMRYLSHLELMTVMQRAIRRAGFPIEYTKGFHPTQKLSLGPPLGVGIAGKREYFDMEIVPPFDLRSNTRKINATLPEGIYVNDMAVVPAHAQSLNSFITRYEYLIGGADYSNADAFLSEKAVNVKRKDTVVNIRDMVEEIEVLDEDLLSVILVDRGTRKVRLGEIIPLLLQKPMEELDVTRISLYGWNGRWVRPIVKHNTKIVEYKT